eukprot:scaffold5417_cov129-Isochrysis_galbana.AAC.1
MSSQKQNRARAPVHPIMPTEKPTKRKSGAPVEEATGAHQACRKGLRMHLPAGKFWHHRGVLLAWLAPRMFKRQGM